MASRLKTTWRAMATVTMRKIDAVYLTAAAGPTSHSPPPMEVAAMTAPGPMTLSMFRKPKAGGTGRSVTSQGGSSPQSRGRVAPSPKRVSLTGLRPRSSPGSGNTRRSLSNRAGGSGAGQSTSRSPAGILAGGLHHKGRHGHSTGTPGVAGRRALLRHAPPPGAGTSRRRPTPGRRSRGRAGGRGSGGGRGLRPPRAAHRVHLLRGRSPLRRAAPADRRGGQRHRHRLSPPRLVARRAPRAVAGEVPTLRRFAARDVSQASRYPGGRGGAGAVGRVARTRSGPWRWRPHAPRRPRPRCSSCPRSTR